MRRVYPRLRSFGPCLTVHIGHCHYNWDPQWNRVVFSEESYLCLAMHDGRARVRRRRGEKRDPQFNVRRPVHHTVGKMAKSLKKETFQKSYHI